MLEGLEGRNLTSPFILVNRVKFLCLRSHPCLGIRNQLGRERHEFYEILFRFHYSLMSVSFHQRGTQLSKSRHSWKRDVEMSQKVKDRTTLEKWRSVNRSCRHQTGDSGGFRFNISTQLKQKPESKQESTKRNIPFASSLVSTQSLSTSFIYSLTSSKSSSRIET